MQKIAIVTDSTANLPADMLAGLPVTVLPLKIIWNGVVLRDGVDISSADFYSRLVRDQNMPTTSQVTAEEFRQAFEDLAKNYRPYFCPAHFLGYQRHCGFRPFGGKGIQSRKGGSLRFATRLPAAWLCW